MVTRMGCPTNSGRCSIRSFKPKKPRDIPAQQTSPTASVAPGGLGGGIGGAVAELAGSEVSLAFMMHQAVRRYHSASRLRRCCCRAQVETVERVFVLDTSRQFPFNTH